MDNNYKIMSAAISDRGLSEKRPQNEDSFLEMEQCGIYAVADGVGGAQAGEVASQMAVEILGEAFANLNDTTDAETVMRTAIERANASINQMAQELPQLANMATTIVSLHLAGNIATIGHVGDSRLYRVDRDGTLYRDTDDHSVVAEEVRAGRMSEEQAENHPSRNIISRALGAEPTVQIDLKTIMVDPGTSFLICSDGITRHVGDDEIKGVLTFGGEPAEVCDYLKNLCYERGAEDNLTAVVVKIPASDSVAREIGADILEFEEPTLAAVRPISGNVAPNFAQEDELLELETQEIPKAKLEEFEKASESESHHDLMSSDEAAEDPAVDLFEQPEVNAVDDEDIASPPVLDDQYAAETLRAIDLEPIAASVEPEAAAMAPDPVREESGLLGYTYVEEKPSAFTKIAGAIGLILLGGVLGFGVYHFMLPQTPVASVTPPISQMKTDNIPLSAFEENRRNVDKDPAGYLAKFSSNPQDSEDYYLVGRAYLLTSDFPKARIAFTESQNRLGEADPVNAKVLSSDLAMALAVTHDTTIQSMLKKELDAAVATKDTNINTSSNR